MLAGGVVVEQVGRGLADALPEAFGGLPQFPRLHVLGDGLFCFNVCSTGSAVFFRSVG